ncbi:putative ABC transport system permease protein [Granulicella aggregans]|uniref:Putative ABC transport system permease protein n=1 Tax=Granulicella aggregans TaxID=474949 RepID=A0A7W7ZCK9_9BACT|nr:ABC transporter permease [Granulicella aggregans]MBB5057297.1 putative ABC transport system permease protein [Granulicella aggregans]
MATANIPNLETASPSTESRRNAGSRRRFERTLASARKTMMFSEVLQLAYDSFKASKVRFLLTMLGMVIGSASIVLVVTLGLTGKEYALNLISSIGPNMIEMQYSGGSIAGPDNTTNPDFMTREDMLAVQEQVPGLAAASPMLEAHDNVNIGDGLTKNVMILGVSPQYKDVRNSVVVAGRFFDDQDATGHTKVAVLVEPLAITLFGSADGAVGQTLSIRGIPFTIIGVFKERINTFGQSEISEQTMLIPYTVARYFTGTDTVKEIFFSTKSTSSVTTASAQILKIIQGRHRASSVYKAFVMTPVLELMGKIANMLTLVLTLAAFVTLIVSGVGIMNSMLANVQARVKEIGIRKALGATSREIRLQFLTEAVFLSLSGGLVGTLIGLAIPFSVRFFTPFAIPVDWWSAIVALATSMIVGIVFGTLPANRAARLNPVDTLKYE